MSKDIKNIHQRKLAVMEELSYIKKNSQNTHFKYKGVKHDDVTREVRELLVKHKIAVNVNVLSHSTEIIPQKTGSAFMTTADVQVEFINVDNPDDKTSSVGFGHGIDRNDLAPGKSISYAVKNIYLKEFALETGELDNEVNATPENELHEPQQQKPDPVREAFARIRDNLEKLEPEKLADYWDENIKHILAMPGAGQAALQAIYDKRAPKGDNDAPF